MERANREHLSRSSLLHEHTHRYMLAARVARGSVVDCACGIGYGSKILRQNERVSSYLGVDPSLEAIDEANAQFNAPTIKFQLGALESLPCPVASIDTFVMFETLEHTENPALAIASVRKHLASNGILIGSVPSADYEFMCEQAYGPNPYHLQRFSSVELAELLKSQFECVRLFSAEFLLGTLVRELPSDFDNEQGLIVADKSKTIAGSLLFLAGTEASVVEALDNFGGYPQFIAGMPKVILDMEEVEPVRTAFFRAEAMINERDQAIAGQAKMLEDRWSAIQSMEVMLNERNKVFAAQTRLLEDSMLEIESMKIISIKRDQFFSEQSQFNQAVTTSLATSFQLCNPKAVFEKLAATKHGTPFVELAFSLSLFIYRLYHAAQTDGVRDLFFFAREGQQLKKMFDYYQSLHGNSEVIQTHYLKVSRRSTFLLSLGALELEDFSVLFRQYRRISLLDFLKSLDLDEYTRSLTSALEISENELTLIREDLPTDSLFQKLIQLELFRQIYEEQRAARSNTFEIYMKTLLKSDVLPDELYVVDVGWKGSIQDNLYKWFRKAQGETARLKGYYLGLIAKGAISSQNLKSGLLFSNINRFTRGFYTFNENRALFEIILHADHGSARRYILDEQNYPLVIEDDFNESPMIIKNVRAVSESIIQFFYEITAMVTCAVFSEQDLLRMSIKFHRRMVFAPTDKEIEWIHSVSHVENFGVFEESWFQSSRNSPDLLKKLLFTWNLVRHRRSSELGFWPWLTIKNSALPGVSGLYSFFRRGQSANFFPHASP